MTDVVGDLHEIVDLSALADETADARDKAVKDHLEGLSKRFAAGLKLIEGDKNVDHLEGLSQRYANGSKGHVRPANAAGDLLLTGEDLGADPVRRTARVTR
jgi:hypothetical protein